MNLQTEQYLTQSKRWPASGRHILAQFDAETVLVYQAYRPAIGRFAAQQQRFGGEFSLNRMSWIKPNFLWMMYRSGWGTKEGQEVTLAVRLRRAGFDNILRQAVHSSYMPEIYASPENWKARLAESPSVCNGTQITIPGMVSKSVEPFNSASLAKFFGNTRKTGL